MTMVDFLRHGETTAHGALVGRADPSLTEAGHAAIARQLGERRWPVVISSPLKRARETAEIAARDSAATIEIDPAWREIDFGDWDGRHHRDLAGDAHLAAFYADPEGSSPPNGETMGEVRGRVTGALDRVAAHGQGPVLVVAHGGSIRVALSILVGLPLERLWAFRIGYATRIRVEMGVDPAHGLWGEIIEIVQPPGEPAQ